MIAEYVDEVVVEELRYRWSENPDEQELAMFGATVAALEILEQIVIRSPYLGFGPTSRSRRAEKIPWILGFQWGSEEPILSLLLTMLPKVHTIRLRGAVDRLWFKPISRIAADPTAVTLSHLTFIELNLDSQTDQNGLRPLATIARLPSLAKLHVRNAYEPVGEHLEDLRLQANTSNVAELSLENQDTCWRSLGAFLGIFRALRRFVYKPCDPPDLDGLKSVKPEFHPSKIVTVLLEHAGNTLEHMTLYAGSRRLEWMGSLSRFGVLTSLSTDSQLLIDDGSSSPTQLANNLPVSIQRIELKVHPSFNLETASDLIGYLVWIRDTQLPSLVSIKLLHMSEESARGLLDRSFVAEARDIGLTIDCDVSEDPDVTSRALLVARKAYDMDVTIGRFFMRRGGILDRNTSFAE